MRQYQNIPYISNVSPDEFGCVKEILLLIHSQDHLSTIYVLLVASISSGFLLFGSAKRIGRWYRKTAG